MRNTSPPSSWWKSGPSKKPASRVFSEICSFETSAELHQTTRCYILEDKTLDRYNIRGKLSNILELPLSIMSESVQYSVTCWLLFLLLLLLLIFDWITEISFPVMPDVCRWLELGRLGFDAFTQLCSFSLNKLSCAVTVVTKYTTEILKLLCLLFSVSLVWAKEMNRPEEKGV